MYALAPRLSRDFGIVNNFFDRFWPELTGLNQTAESTEISDTALTYRCRIPDNADLSAIAATITDGVLEITVPFKKPESKKVEIKVS